LAARRRLPDSHPAIELLHSGVMKALDWSASHLNSPWSPIQTPCND
jgi:hypothetical protein